MHKYEWDPITGGILLLPQQEKSSKEPRPVYYREMNLLGMDKRWKYPQNDDAPIMWAEAEKYYYYGKLVARTRGGSLYTAPQIIYEDSENGEPEGSELIPVDITLMCEKNFEIMSNLVEDTVQRTYDAYDKYVNKVDVFHVSFSGGKDSVSYDAFPEDSVLKEEGLDELKHHGTKYDFRFTTEPLHIFDELDILDRDLKKMSSSLAMENQLKRIIILSDHGASRLAVTYQSENDKLQLKEPGQHSGRCCPADQDPGMDFVTFEDGFAVLANYERFRGSRKADVEAHGGATLEETVIPVIILTLKPKKQEIFFVDSVVSCSPREGSTIRMFANPPLKDPRMLVNGEYYDGVFDGDKHNIVFVMPDIRRKGHHEAEIYDGGVKKAVLTFETKRQTGTNQLL